MDILARVCEKAKFPTSVASFEKLRQRGMHYVDKTEMIWQLANTSEVAFLSRPRRFGKSMIIHTMKSYFEGKRELFEGLKLMPLEEAKGEAAWVKHPVLHFDFSKLGSTVKSIQGVIRQEVKKHARRNGITIENTEPTEALNELLDSMEENDLPPVAVLIDEYDNPILEALAKGDPDRLDEVREYLRGFYKTLKANDERLRFLMVTGISQVRQMGLFSGFNHIRDISFSPEFNSICGFTEAEIRQTLWEPVQKLGEVRGLTAEQQMEELKYRYDGYRFSAKEEDVYNPYGIMNALLEDELQDSWTLAGTTTSADALVPRYNALGVMNLDGKLDANRKTLSRFNFESNNPIPFLYQTGYLTIKGIAPNGHYLLDFPNREVRESIMVLLAPKTLGIKQDADYYSLQQALVRALNGTDIHRFEDSIQALLASLPYDREGDTAQAWALREQRYQDAMHLILVGVRSDVRVEQIGLGGISDVEINGKRMTIVLELKMAEQGKTAEDALEQALKYTPRHASQENAVWAVGAVIGEKGHIAWAEKMVKAEG